ncbi:MAG TPA: glycosyltransferase family 39 protein [Polyangiaceae bacterium]|nr:glycosyltransferase family 39 protein [Polyangiaceae bacterium]
MSSPPRTLDWRWWAWLLGAAILLRTIVVLGLLGGMPMVSDAHDYFDFAVKLAAGDIGGAFYWPVGESALLAVPFAVLGPSVMVARLATIAMSAASIVLTTLLGRELGGPRVARVAGWMAAAYAPNVLLCGQTYSQHLAALCLVALAYFGLRALSRPGIAPFCAAGLALGIGCLTRPSMVSVIPVLLMAWVLTARARRPSFARLCLGGAAAAVVTLACVAPVLLHDADAGVGYVLSTNNERNFFLGNNPYTHDYATAHLGQRSLDQLAPEPRAYLESFYERADSRSAMRRAAIAYACDHPFRTAWRTFNRSLAFWGFDYLASREIQKWFGWSALTTLPLLAVEAGTYCAIAALAVVALFVMCDAGRLPVRAWLVCLALSYEIPYALAFSGGTYHFPVVPLIIPLAALAVVELRRPGVELRLRAGAGRAGALALCVFAAVEAQYAYYTVVMSG